MDEWMRNIAAHPELGVAGNKPAQAVDSCFRTDGSLLASGDDVWDGILDDGPREPARRRSRSIDVPDRRRRADRGRRLQVRAAVGRAGVVGASTARGSRTRAARSAAADLPDGVCDYRSGIAGCPPELKNGR